MTAAVRSLSPTCWGETSFFGKFIVGNDFEWIDWVKVVQEAHLKNWGETEVKFVIGNDFLRWLSKSCVRGAYVFAAIFLHIFLQQIWYDCLLCVFDMLWLYVCLVFN